MEKRCTNVNLISYKRRGINHLIIHLNQSPVSGVTVGLNHGLDLLRVEHETDDALVKGGAVLSDLAVEHVHLLDLPRRILHPILVLPAPLSDLSLDERPQPSKHTVPDINGVAVVANGGGHGLNGLIKAAVTKHDDLLTSLAVVCTCHARVAKERKGAGYMGTC